MECRFCKQRYAPEEILSHSPLITENGWEAIFHEDGGWHCNNNRSAYTRLTTGEKVYGFRRGESYGILIGPLVPLRALSREEWYALFGHPLEGLVRN